MEIIRIEKIEEKIIILENQKVILDTDVANLYACPELVVGVLKLNV